MEVVCVLFVFIICISYYEIQQQIPKQNQMILQSENDWLVEVNANERESDNETKETRAKRSIQNEIINLKHGHTLTPLPSHCQIC